MPVHPHARRILIDPTLQLIDRSRGISLHAGQAISFGQTRQMLVPVELVNVLRIASFRILLQSISAPEAALPLLPSYGIAVPIDCGTEIDARESQQFDSM